MRIGTVLRPLEDRKGALGGVNRAVLVGPAKRLAQLPDLSRRALSRIQLGLDGVTEMDWSTSTSKLSGLTLIQHGEASLAHG
jgi:glycine betaine/proline transport system substrate-binding protein